MDEAELRKIWPESSGWPEGKCEDWRRHAPHAWQKIGDPPPISFWEAIETPAIESAPLTIETYWCWGMNRGSR